MLLTWTILKCRCCMHTQISVPTPILGLTVSIISGLWINRMGDLYFKPFSTLFQLFYGGQYTH